MPQSGHDGAVRSLSLPLGRAHGPSYWAKETEVIEFAALALCLAELPKVSVNTSFDWNESQIDQLREWVNAAPDDALPRISMTVLDRAQADGDQFTVDKEASRIALALGRLHLEGCTAEKARSGWTIESQDSEFDLEYLLGEALSHNELALFFSLLLPRHPDYLRLRLAYSQARNPSIRATLARNMERWRWMPLLVGDSHIIVNAAAFQVSYTRNGETVGRWPVIVGKPTTPTPIFSAQAVGVTLNPWWDVPQSIATESIGPLYRRNPAAARRQGYIWADGRYRQRPGPSNALGQVKIEMPNSFSVFLHDTPNRKLFAEPVRAFSHGCVRVGDAVGFASALLGKDKTELGKQVAVGKTVTLPLKEPVPVYVAYFTAASDETGTIRFYPDIYERDAVAGNSANLQLPCPG
jgi:L,D-transpeptidase YcbB